MSKLIILLLVTVIVFGGFFIGLICLQVHISKNNKKGKFAIPVIMFLLPLVAIVLMLTSFMAVRDSGISEVNSTEIVDVAEEDEGEVMVTDEGNIATALGSSIIVVVYSTIVVGWPTAIITLIIELIYRSKRKQVADEDVIEIQNL